MVEASEAISITGRKEMNKRGGMGAGGRKTERGAAAGAMMMKKEKIACKEDSLESESLWIPSLPFHECCEILKL